MTAEQAEQQARQLYIEARAAMPRADIVAAINGKGFAAEDDWSQEDLAVVLWSLVGQAEWRVRQKMYAGDTPAAEGWREQNLAVIAGIKQM